MSEGQSGACGNRCGSFRTVSVDTLTHQAVISWLLPALLLMSFVIPGIFASCLKILILKSKGKWFPFLLH